MTPYGRLIRAADVQAFAAARKQAHRRKTEGRDAR
jgi:hypothetical protein